MLFPYIGVSTLVRKSITFEMGNLKGLTYTNLKQTVDNLMNDVLVMTKADLIQKLPTIPKDTGVMRSTVKKNINKSNYQRPYVLSLFFGAPELDYTKDVEMMETYGSPHVRHEIDPKAEGHPFSKMAAYAKERVKLNWNKAKLSRTGIP